MHRTNCYYDDLLLRRSCVETRMVVDCQFQIRVLPDASIVVDVLPDSDHDAPHGDCLTLVLYVRDFNGIASICCIVSQKRKDLIPAVEKQARNGERRSIWAQPFSRDEASPKDSTQGCDFDPMLS